MDDKIAPNGRGKGPGRNFLIKKPLPNFGMGEARNFTFRTQIDHSKCQSVDDKFCLTERSRSRFRDPLFKLWEASIYFEWVTKARRF